MADTEDVTALATELAGAVFAKELNLRKAFSRLDQDKNGTLDKEEFAALLGGLSQACTKSAADAVFDLFDVDKNGAISPVEFQEALLDYGGQTAAPPPSSRAAPVAKKPARHVEALQEAADYVAVDGDTMTDADVMDELSDRLEAEGVAMHTLFRVLAPREGRMTEDSLRSVLEKMGASPRRPKHLRGLSRSAS